MRLILMKSCKKAQSANEAAAIIAILTFFLVVTLAAVSDDVIRASDDNYKALLQDVADFIEEEARTAMGSENGYYHEFTLPELLNNQQYAVGIVNSTSIGSQVNISILFVSSGNQGIPLNITKVLARDIRGSVAIGKNSVRKENGIVILTSVPFT